MKRQFFRHESKRDAAMDPDHIWKSDENMSLSRTAKRRSLKELVSLLNS